MKKFIAVFLFLAAGVFVQAQTLSWDIKFLKGSTQESVPISQIIRMERGEIFQFSVLPDSFVHCYIILYDSQRDVFVLHNQPIAAGQERFFGPFRIEDPPGTETIYVIMSLERQVNLENLVQNFNSNPGSRQSANNLYREVVNIQNMVSRLGEPASSYIPSGGTTRGSTQQHVTRFSGNNLYVRAIAIRH